MSDTGEFLRGRDRVDAEFVRGFLREFDGAWRDKDPGRIVAMCSEDVVMDDGGQGHLFRGREAIEEFIGGLFRTARTVEVESKTVYVAVDGLSAVVQRVYRIDRTDVDEPVVIDTASVFGFADGEISSWAAYVRDCGWFDRVSP